VLRDCGGINSTGVTAHLILIYAVHSSRCNTGTDFMQVGALHGSCHYGVVI
jgi:hypothetical protein